MNVTLSFKTDSSYTSDTATLTIKLRFCMIGEVKPKSTYKCVTCEYGYEPSLSWLSSPCKCWSLATYVTCSRARPLSPVSDTSHGMLESVSAMFAPLVQCATAART